MKDKLLLKLLLLLAAQQLAFILLFPPAHEPDSLSFITVAAQAAQTGSFSAETRLPGYPAFLAALYLPFGQADLPVVIAQHLLGLLLWFLLARRLETDRQKLLFTGLFALDLLYSSYQHALLSDFLFSFLLCAGALAAGGPKRERRLSGALLAGLFVAAGMLTKPALKFFPVFILPFLLIGPGPLRGKLRYAAVFLVLPLLAVNLWSLRNYRETGRYSMLPMETYHYIGRVVNHIEFPAGSVSEKYFREQMPEGRVPRNRRGDVAHIAENNMRRDGIKTETLDAEFRDIFRLSILRRPFAYLNESLTELFYFFFSAHNLYAKFALKDRLPVSAEAGLNSRDFGGFLLKVAVSLHPFYWAVAGLFFWFTALNWRRLAAGGDIFFLYSLGLVAYIALVSSFANEGLARYRGAVHPLMLYFSAGLLARLFPGKAEAPR